VRGRVRKMRVPRFPYSVLYSVVDAQIRVPEVAHDRRRAHYWTGRSSRGANKRIQQYAMMWTDRTAPACLLMRQTLNGGVQS